jgi:hypothetical protein
MGVGSDLFLHPRVEPSSDLHKIEFRYGFYFSPAGAPETRKNPKGKKRNPKPKKKPERNTFVKPDEHTNPTQNLTGSDLDASFHRRYRFSVQFNPTLFFQS